MTQKIVSAVGVSASSLSNERKGLAKHIERAMADAVLACMEDGVTDDGEIRARMQGARNKARGSF